MGIAQALVHRPNLLILDEPTNGLDAQGIMELRNMLKRLAHEEGVAILVSSHQLFEMEQMCDRICIISRGKIAAINTIEELRALGGEDNYLLSTADVNRAVEILNSAGKGNIIKQTAEGKLTLVASDEEISGIIKLLSTSDVLITGVNKITASLEEAYIEILNGGAKK